MPQATERVLVLAPLPPELRTALAARHPLVEYAPGLPEAGGFRVAVTTSMAGADAALLAALPGLRLLGCNGTGLDRIDGAEAARRGIAVCHTPDAVTQDTADAAVALYLAAVRRIAEGDRFVRAGRWGAERMAPSHRASGRRAGIVGLGRIGAAVARRMAGLDMAVAYAGPRAKPDVPWRYVPEVGALAEQSDVLVLCCPGGQATRHLVDAAVLRRLGPDGVLVNISRGSVVAEDALLAALRDNTILAAGLDVFEAEPALDPRFLALDNVVLTPHSAAVTRETRAAMADTILAAIDGFLAASPLAPSPA